MDCWIILKWVLTENGMCVCVCVCVKCIALAQDVDRIMCMFFFP